MPGKREAGTDHRRHADGGGRHGRHGRPDVPGQDRGDISPGRELDRPNDPRSPDEDMLRGRSDMSPGHLKKAQGARSAREFAPGQLRKHQG